MDRSRWAVIGGGMLGMTLAHRLARAGACVTLFEAAPYLGGLAAPWALGDVVWDRYYHVMLESDRHLAALLDEVGLRGEVRWTQTKTGFYTDGQLFSLSNSIEFLRFPPLTLIDKLRLAATILYAANIKNWKRLEGIGVIEWLQRYSGRRTVEKIWLPLLRAKLGEQYRHTSAAFIWATIARMYAARRSGMKTERFGYVRGGYARVVGCFSAVLRNEGVRIELGRPAETVEPISAGRVGVEFADGTREAFDRVVVTTAAPLAARLCRGLSHEERTRLNGIRYLGIVCASALLTQPLADFYITNVTDSWVPFTAVIEMSALVERTQFGGLSLVYLPKYVASDDAILGRSDEEVQAEWIAALARMYPRFRAEQVRCVRLSRAPHVLAVSTLGYSDRLPPMVTSVPGLAVVNAAHIVNATLNVNQTVHLANRAAAMLLASPRDETTRGVCDADRQADREPIARPR